MPGLGLALLWRFATWLAAIWLLVLWWARIVSLFFVSIRVLPVTYIAVGVIFLSVALWAVVWALRSFLHGGCLRVAVVVKVEPIRGIEV